MAQIKKLPIRQHDTRANRGGQRFGQKVATAALDRVDRIKDPSSREALRETLGQMLEAEQAKGVRSARAGVRQDRADWERRKLAVRGVADPLARMKRDTQLLTEKFAHDLRRSQIVAAGQGPNRKEGQARKMSGVHNAHARMAVMSAMGPLRQGVNLSSVLQVMGTMSAMYLLSPQVRSVVGDYRPKVVGKIKEMIQDRSSDRLDDKAMDKLERAQGQGKGLDSLGKRWQRRLEKMEAAGPDFREPFTNETAAMVEIGLAESAYAAMRDPSVPADKLREHRLDVLASYESARQVFDEYIAEDGLDRADVARSARVIVGRRMEAEPHLASVFGELGHGRFVRSEPQEVYLRGKSKPQMVWTGNFTDAVSGRDIGQGTFSLRMPGNRADHLESCTTTLEAELGQARTLEDLNEMFASYTAASVVRQYPDMPKEVADPSVRKRMTRAQAMFSSMRADGISQSDQRFIYAASFVNAMESVGRDNPELVGKWEAQFGPQWQHDVRRVVQDYSDMGARAEDRLLVKAMVARGFDESDVVAEVRDLREQHAMDPNAGPLMAPLTPAVEQYGQVPPPGKFVARLPRRAKGDKAVMLLNQMREWIASDLAHEADKAGQYEPGSTERLTGPGSGEEAFVGSEVFIGKVMEDYANPAAQAALGREARQRGERPGTDMARRRDALVDMYAEMDKLGIPLATQDAMMSAAYVNGLERLAQAEPFHVMAIEENIAWGTTPHWREELYQRTLDNTERHRYLDDPAYRRFSARMSPEEAAQRQAAGHEGYAVWEREFDKLDEVEVAGQAKVGELSIPGSDSVRDRVSGTVGQLSDATRASAAQQARRRQRTAVRKNLAYNAYDDAQPVEGLERGGIVLQAEGDGTSGREPEFGG